MAGDKSSKGNPIIHQKSHHLCNGPLSGVSAQQPRQKWKPNLRENHGKTMVYPLVNQHNYGKSPFSIAMLNYQRVCAGNVLAPLNPSLAHEHLRSTSGTPRRQGGQEAGGVVVISTFRKAVPATGNMVKHGETW